MTDSEEFGVAIIDRIEGTTAVLEVIEPNFQFQIPTALLPDEAREGSAVELDFKLRPDIEEKRREKIRELQQELIEKPDEEQ